MRKCTSYLLSFFMLFGLCVFYPINPVYANNNSVQQDKKEFDKKVDALTVDGVQSYRF